MVTITTTMACTSMILSGSVTNDGRPVMFKHQDADNLHKCIKSFQGPKYAFRGVVNVNCDSAEVWSGMNDVGLCIMNTASYNFREDTFACPMDREGLVMGEILGSCGSVQEVEAYFAAQREVPLGVEANFGVIDAHGNACYFEVNNTRFVKYPVDSYRIVTNFCVAGRDSDRMGVERLATAQTIMQEHYVKGLTFNHNDVLRLFSQQYRHEVLGVNYTSDNAPDVSVDQDFIPRRSTATVTVYEGVRAGEDPNHTVLWALLGYPATGVAIPVLNNTLVPEYLSNGNICEQNLQLKDTYVFPYKVSNGNKYFNLGVVLKATDGRPSLLSCAQQAQQTIDSTFYSVFRPYQAGTLKPKKFIPLYLAQQPEYLTTYQKVFKSWWR